MNIKKNYYNFFKKSFVLVDAHMNNKKIPAELQGSYAYVLKTVPKLMNSIINLSLPVSTVMFKTNPHPEIKFAGIDALKSMIFFEQRFIQGCNMDSLEIAQLGLTKDELEKIAKKRRNKLPALQTLQADEEEMEKFLSLLEEYRKPAIKSEILSFPLITAKVEAYIPGDEEINDRGLL